MPLPVPSTEPRALDALRRHYEIERSLAERLRVASKAERRDLYSRIYDEFFRRVTDLPRLADDPEAQRHVVELQARALEPLLRADAVFLEIGSGDGALALHVARRVRRVYAVEASAEAAAGLEPPENFELVLSDRMALDLESGSVDVAYSCHFLEHLHPDDALDHAAEVRRVLRPGGAYLCVTPNRLWGPHDVSQYFDDEPTGFHLREYTHAELARLFRRAGFRRTAVQRELEGAPRLASVRPYRVVEGLLGALPTVLRRRVMALVLRRGQPPFRPLEQVRVVGWA